MPLIELHVHLKEKEETPQELARKRRRRDLFFLANLIFVFVGGCFLIWYYLIDGKLVNKPITWVNTDPMALQLERETYAVGETPRFLMAYCKGRLSTFYIEWTLIDGQKVLYSEREAGHSPIGCYPAHGFIKEDIDKIPLTIEETCDAFFTANVRGVMSGGREVRFQLKTEKFCIKASEVLEKVEEEIKEEIKEQIQ